MPDFNELALLPWGNSDEVLNLPKEFLERVFNSISEAKAGTKKPSVQWKQILDELKEQKDAKYRYERFGSTGILIYDRSDPSKKPLKFNQNRIRAKLMSQLTSESMDMTTVAPTSGITIPKTPPTVPKLSSIASPVTPGPVNPTPVESEEKVNGISTYNVYNWRERYNDFINKLRQEFPAFDSLKNDTESKQESALVVSGDTERLQEDTPKLKESIPIKELYSSDYKQTPKKEESSLSSKSSFSSPSSIPSLDSTIYNPSQSITSPGLSTIPSGEDESEDEDPTRLLPDESEVREGDELAVNTETKERLDNEYKESGFQFRPQFRNAFKQAQALSYFRTKEYEDIENKRWHDFSFVPDGSGEQTYSADSGQNQVHNYNVVEELIRYQGKLYKVHPDYEPPGQNFVWTQRYEGKNVPTPKRPKTDDKASNKMLSVIPGETNLTLSDFPNPILPTPSSRRPTISQYNDRSFYINEYQESKGLDNKKRKRSRAADTNHIFRTFKNNFD